MIGRRGRALVLAAGIAVAAAAAGAARSEEKPGEGAPAVPPAKPSIVRFPSLRVDLARRVVEADGRVCLQRGLIEVFACTEYGKVHEAVAILDCRPENLHAAMILLGMTEKRGQIAVLGDGGELEGDRAIVTVAWKDEAGAEVAHRAEELLLDAQAGGTMEPCGFAFTGSRFVKIGEKEVFAANSSGQMITTYHDPDAILDNPLRKGGDDTVYYANSKLLPLPGTPIVVRIEPAPVSATAAPNEAPRQR